MSDGVIVTLLTLAVLLGVGSAAFLVMRSPAFWADVGKEMLTKAWPKIWLVLTKRMSEAEEEEMRREYRAGRGDEWIRNVWMRRKRKK